MATGRETALSCRSNARAIWFFQTTIDWQRQSKDQQHEPVEFVTGRCPNLLSTGSLSSSRPTSWKGCGLFVPPAPSTLLREGNHMTEKTNVTISTVTTILFLGVLGAFLWFVVSGNKLAKPGVIVLALLLAAAVGVMIPSWVRYLQRKR